MQMDMSLSSSDCDRHDLYEDVEQSIDLISSGFNRQLDLKFNNDHDDDSSQLSPDLEAHVDDEHHEDEDNDDNDDNDDDFTFMIIGDDESEIYADKDGQVRPVFPLFDRKLLLDGEYEVEEIDRLPFQPPVDKVFIESPRGFPSSTAAEHDGAAAGTYCDWSKESATSSSSGTGSTAELSKKSNSTGFSKLWRLKEIVGRSNSDGRDAFVFLKHSDKTTSSMTSSKAVTGERTFVKVNAAGGKSKVVNTQGAKAKKVNVSAHEAYMRSRGGHNEEERRRSYLPYRPELMGFFTNVNGGLSKNVHPY